MRHREPTNAQVLDAFMRVVADERESMRRELQEMGKARDEQLEQLSSKLAELQQLRLEHAEEYSKLQAKIAEEYTKLQTKFAEEKAALVEENNRLRAHCAELHEALLRDEAGP